MRTWRAYQPQTKYLKYHPLFGLTSRVMIDIVGSHQQIQFHLHIDNHTPMSFKHCECSKNLLVYWNMVNKHRIQSCICMYLLHMAYRTDLRNLRNICFEWLHLLNHILQLIHHQSDFYQQEVYVNLHQVWNVNVIQVITYLLYLRPDLWYHSTSNFSHPCLSHCNSIVKMWQCVHLNHHHLRR